MRCRCFAISNSPFVSGARLQRVPARARGAGAWHRRDHRGLQRRSSSAVEAAPLPRARRARDGVGGERRAPPRSERRLARELHSLARAAAIFTELGLYSFVAQTNLTGLGEPREIVLQGVSPATFILLG